MAQRCKQFSHLGTTQLIPVCAKVGAPLYDRQGEACPAVLEISRHSIKVCSSGKERTPKLGINYDVITTQMDFLVRKSKAGIRSHR